MAYVDTWPKRSLNNTFSFHSRNLILRYFSFNAVATLGFLAASFCFWMGSRAFPSGSLLILHPPNFFVSLWVYLSSSQNGEIYFFLSTYCLTLFLFSQNRELSAEAESCSHHDLHTCRTVNSFVLFFQVFEVLN